LRDLESQHAGKHSYHEDESLHLARAERDQGGAGTKPRKSPTNAESKTAEHEAAVDLAGIRQLHRCSEERHGAFSGQEKGRHTDGDRTRHHQRKRGIPAAGEIQEAQHLGRVHQPRYDQADTKHESGNK